MQFQTALGMISKIKTSHTSELNKDSMIQTCNFIEKRLHRRCFPVITAKFLRTPILKNIYERLLLEIYLVLLF